MFENLHSHAQYVYFHNDLYGEGNIITLLGGLEKLIGKCIIKYLIYKKKMLLEFTSFSIKNEVYIFKRVFPRIK